MYLGLWKSNPYGVFIVQFKGMTHNSAKWMQKCKTPLDNVKRNVALSFVSVCKKESIVERHLQVSLRVVSLSLDIFKCWSFADNDTRQCGMINIVKWHFKKNVALFSRLLHCNTRRITIGSVYMSSSKKVWCYSECHFAFVSIVSRCPAMLRIVNCRSVNYEK